MEISINDIIDSKAKNELYKMVFYKSSLKFDYLYNECEYDGFNFHNVFIKTDISNLKEIELPAIIESDIYTFLKNIEINFEQIDEDEEPFKLDVKYLVKGLPYNNTSPNIYPNASIKCARLLSILNCSDYLIPLKVKDTIYYGCKSLIMDEDFNILFLLTKKLSFINHTYNITDINAYINPKVFLSQKNILINCILNKIIPYLSALRKDIIIKDVTDKFITNTNNMVVNQNFQNTLNDIKRHINIDSIKSIF